MKIEIKDSLVAICDFVAEDEGISLEEAVNMLLEISVNNPLARAYVVGYVLREFENVSVSKLRRLEDAYNQL